MTSVTTSSTPTIALNRVGVLLVVTATTLRDSAR
jgi:hypothetical protein